MNTTGEPSAQASRRHDFRILCLDGGGIRGVFAAAFLAELEENLEHSVGDYFDLIAGTSTGGVIALALAAGRSAGEIRDLYSENARTIFKPRVQPIWLRTAARALGWVAPKMGEFIKDAGLWESKYEQAALRTVLESEFGGLTIEDLVNRVVVPAVDLTTSRNVVFKTPHLPELTRDRGFKLVDVALATSAAPTYFPHASIGPGSAYADGGLWANNPSIVAYAEAVRIRELCTRECDPRFEPSDVFMLSVGTGRSPHHGQPGPTDTGLLWWGSRLINVIGLSQSLGYHNQAAYLLGDRYARIDFSLPDPTWTLDNIAVVDVLIHLGQEEATRNRRDLQHDFFSDVRRAYEAFPLPADLS